MRRWILSFSWKYEEAPVYTVTYAFVSATQGKALPDDIPALLPALQAFAQGTEVTFTEPSSLRVETANGAWTFNGYNVETLAATCLKEGHVEHYVCKNCHELAIEDGDAWKKVTEADVVEAVTGHETVYVDVDSDGSSTGNVAYYKCRYDCGTLFADKDGDEEVTGEQITNAAEVRKLINNLPVAPGIGDKARVDAANKAFNALSAREKPCLIMAVRVVWLLRRQRLKKQSLRLRRP